MADSNAASCVTATKADGIATLEAAGPGDLSGIGFPTWMRSVNVPTMQAESFPFTDFTARCRDALTPSRVPAGNPGEGWKFKRQEQIGDFIVDFVCFRARLIVEADGSQHAESEADVRRTKWLEAQGFGVIRFWNNEILANPDGVAIAILSALKPPLPNPSPARGEGL